MGILSRHSPSSPNQFARDLVSSIFEQAFLLTWVFTHSTSAFLIIICVTPATNTTTPFYSNTLRTLQAYFYQQSCLIPSALLEKRTRPLLRRHPRVVRPHRSQSALRDLRILSRLACPTRCLWPSRVHPRRRPPRLHTRTYQSRQRTPPFPPGASLTSKLPSLQSAILVRSRTPRRTRQRCAMLATGSRISSLLL